MKKLPSINPPKDVDVWEEEVLGVKRIKQPEEKPSSPLIISEVEPSLRTEGLYNANSFNPLTVGATNNIDRNTAEKFIKGQMPIDSRLDLHGRTEKEAFSAVEDFIKNCYIQNKRCILIITGKGIKKDDTPWYESKGIIREALPAWLNHPNIRPFILSVSVAKQEDGGSGAFYVLLKRQRQSNPSKEFE